MHPAPASCTTWKVTPPLRWCPGEGTTWLLLWQGCLWTNAVVNRVLKQNVQSLKNSVKTGRAALQLLQQLSSVVHRIELHGQESCWDKLKGFIFWLVFSCRTLNSLAGPHWLYKHTAMHVYTELHTSKMLSHVCSHVRQAGMETRVLWLLPWHSKEVSEITQNCTIVVFGRDLQDHWVQPYSRSHG